jgi:hypothetical protein
MSRFWIGAGMLGLGLLAAPYAQAQTQTFTDIATEINTPLTFGTGANQWTVTITGCSATASGVANCANDEVVGVVTTGVNASLSLTYETTTNPGTNALVSESGSTDDLTITETVVAPGNTSIGRSSLGMTGLLNGNPSTDAPVSETGGVALNTCIGCGNGVSPYTVSQRLATAQHSLAITKDINTSFGSGTVEIQSVVQTFNVPEPASLSLLALGFGGVIGLRRRRRARTVA